MAKKKTVTKKSAKADQNLMLLAAAAVFIVGFFAVITYKSQASLSLPTPNPVATIMLPMQNNSGEKGTATLQEVDGKVLVTLSMTGFAAGISQPAHIHLGKCPNPGAIKFPLSPVVNGQSVTSLNTTLEALKALEPLAINVHKSSSLSNIYVSCGNLSL